MPSHLAAMLAPRPRWGDWRIIYTLRDADVGGLVDSLARVDGAAAPPGRRVGRSGLGAAVWVRAISAGWVLREPGSRVVRVTAAGRVALGDHLGVAV